MKGNKSRGGGGSGLPVVLALVLMTGLFACTAFISDPSAAEPSNTVYVGSASDLPSDGVLADDTAYILNTSIDLEDLGYNLSVPSGTAVTIDLNGCTLTGTEVSSSMNSVVTVAGSLTVKDSTGGGSITGGTGYAQSAAACYGGGIYVDGGSLTIAGGTISGNTATTTSSSYMAPNSRGGGVYVCNGGSMLMSGGAISGNTSSSATAYKGAGGGIYVDSGCTLTITGGTISGNTAGQGAGIYFAGTEADISGCTIGGSADEDGNISKSSGSALYSISGDVTLSNVTVTHNTSLGSVIVSLYSANLSGSVPNLTLTDCTVSDNTHTGSGNAAVYLSASDTVTITRGSISDNNCGTNGGVYAINCEQLTITGTSITGNSGNNGGGLWVRNTGEVTITGCTITGNTVSGGGFGGAIRVTQSSVTVDGGTLSGSQPASSGLVYTDSSAELTLDSVNISGGVYISEGTLILVGQYEISDPVINRGTVYVPSGSSLKITGSYSGMSTGTGTIVVAGDFSTTTSSVDDYIVNIGSGTVTDSDGDAVAEGSATFDTLSSFIMFSMLCEYAARHPDEEFTGTMTARIAVTSDVIVPSNVTIEGGGRQILVESCELRIKGSIENVFLTTTDATVVVDGSLETGTIYTSFIGERSTLEINGEMTLSSDSETPLNVYRTGTVVVNGTLNASTTADSGVVRVTGTMVNSYAVNLAANVVMVVAGTFENSGTAALAAGMVSEAGSTVVNDSALILGASSSIAGNLENSMTLTLSEGTETAVNTLTIGNGTTASNVNNSGSIGLNNYTALIVSAGSKVSNSGSVSGTDESSVSGDGEFDNLADGKIDADIETETLRYTVTWKNWDGSTLSEVLVDEGTVPEYGGTPVHEPTADHTYEFSGWSPSPVKVSENVVYTATYTEAERTYAVTWLNWDGTELDTDYMGYGETPVYSADTPTRSPETGRTYEFSGWSPEISAVTQDATYTAVFKEVLEVYTVAVAVDPEGYGSVTAVSISAPYGSVLTAEGSVLTLTRPDGSIATSVATPSEGGSATYSFSGWSVESATVTSNMTVTASFDRTVDFVPLPSEPGHSATEVAVSSESKEDSSWFAVVAAAVIAAILALLLADIIRRG